MTLEKAWRDMAIYLAVVVAVLLLWLVARDRFEQRIVFLPFICGVATVSALFKLFWPTHAYFSQASWPFLGLQYLAFGLLGWLACDMSVLGVLTFPAIGVLAIVIVCVSHFLGPRFGGAKDG